MRTEFAVEELRSSQTRGRFVLRLTWRAAPSYSAANRKDQSVNENGYVHRKGPVADVVEVVLDVGVDWGCAIGAKLPEAGNARNDLKPAALPGVIVFNDKWHFRPRTYQRHRAEKYVDELRQFIQAGATEKTANSGNARIAR